MVPLLATSFIWEYKVGLGVVMAIVSFALLVFGWVWAVLDNAQVLRFVVVFLVGGWMFMAITFGIGSSGLLTELTPKSTHHVNGLSQLDVAIWFVLIGTKQTGNHLMVFDCINRFSTSKEEKIQNLT
ncbi:Vacuolar iron transporter-like 4 [Spatholobus suberectus]|nr:Vacuolar iron transporter-like 4 [Spatholobus suberectus]